MKSRAILFQGAMVRAILAGTKTQTRRVAKGVVARHTKTGEALARCDSAGPRVICPYGQPGNRLNVKEAAWMWCERRPNGKTKTGRDKWLYVPMREAPIHYAADHPQKPSISVVSPDTGNAWGWRLKIGRFLPSWASRITLEITAVRVERLQAISEADAIAEGIHRTTTGLWSGGAWKHMLVPNRYEDPCNAYCDLWASINGPGSWDTNPWVWVVEFKKIQGALS